MKREELKLKISVQVCMANCSLLRRCQCSDLGQVPWKRAAWRVILPFVPVLLCVRHVFFESSCLGMQLKVGGKFHLKLNIGARPIANKYREGKMKRTLKRELKST